jgi:group I intron endonuclease
MKKSYYPNSPGIYGITCSVSLKEYIGSASNIRIRVGTHRSLLRNGKSHNAHLQAAWNKYGEAAFTFSVLELVDDRADLFTREQFWLDKLQPEYNKTPRAIGPAKGTKRGPLPAESIAKRTATRRAKMEADPEYKAKVQDHARYMLSKRSYKPTGPMTQERKDKIRAAKLSNPYQYTDEQKTIMLTAAMRGRKGKTLTDEHKRKISEGHKRRLAA